MTKICPKCSTSQDSSCYYSDKSKSDGLSTYCKICRNQKSKEYAKSHKEQIVEYKKEHYILNKEKVDKKNREWRLNNLEKDKANKKEYWKTEAYRVSRRKWKKSRKLRDSNYKLSENLRRRLGHALKSKKWSKTSKFSEYIGCNKEILMNHIESQFKLDMSWGNYGKWELDHIIPLSLAKTEKEMYKLCHYTNLQPLWKIDNIKKGNTICQL